MKLHRITTTPPLPFPARCCESGIASRFTSALDRARRRSAPLLAALLLPSLFAADAVALEATWIGGNALWDNPANWSDGSAYPGAASGTTNTDKAIFTGTPSGTIYLPAHLNLRDLEFLADARITEFRNGTLVFTGGGTLVRESGASYLNIWSNMTLEGAGITVTNGAGLGMIGNIGGTGGISYYGSGGLQVDGLNTYTGKTSFLNTSQVYIKNMANGGSASSVGASGKEAANLVLGTGVTFRYYGAAASTDRSFTHGGGNISFHLNGGALEFTDSAAIAYATPDIASSITFHGNSAADNRINLAIGDNGTGITSIAKYETSKIILSGANSYSGITNVYQGILNIRNSQALGSTVGLTRVSDGVNLPAATLQIEGGIHVGNETLEVANMGFGTESGAVVNVSGENSWAGKVILVHNARLSSDAGSLAFTSTEAITGSNRNLTLNGAGDGSIAAAIATNAGQLSKTGTGTWRLAGASTYGGGTTVSAGTLLINNLSGSGTGSGSVQVASGATLGGNGIIAPGAGSALSVSGIVSAGDALVNGGIGTLTIDAGGTAQPVAVFASGASFRFDLNGATAAGDTLLLLNGSAGDFVFNGNGIEFSISGVLADGQTYLLFDGSDSAQFAGLTLDAENRITGGLTFAPLGEGYEDSYLSLVNGDLNLHIVAVPEGSTLGFLALGALAAAALRRHRHRLLA